MHANEPSPSPQQQQSATVDHPHRLARVRNELKQVINLMEPKSPQIHLTTSSEADNEDTTTTTTISESYRKKIRKLTTNCAQRQPQQQENNTVVDVATMVDFKDRRINRSQSNPNRKSRRFVEWFRRWSFDHNQIEQPNCDLYKINITHQDQDGDIPKRLIFDLIDGIPIHKPQTINVGTNTKFSKNRHNDRLREHHQKRSQQRRIYYDSNGDCCVDYYYFDHGNAQYFQTTDLPPVLYTDKIIEKTEHYTTKFWSEIFSTLHLLTSFCISFVLQLIRFILYGFIKPLILGLIQLFSDYLFKPLLTNIFNSLIQPILIFFYNIATSLRDLCEPLAEGIGYFFKAISILLQSIRLFVYKRIKDNNCDNV